MMYTAVIRQRGQLTIPGQVRDLLVWMREGSVVGIDIEDEEVRIKPHAKTSKKVDWDSLWKKMELSRSFKGKKNEKPLSQMIIEDRENH